MEIKIRYSGNGYYVLIINNNNISFVSDKDISKLLNENVENYLETGVKYNGFLKNDDLYFNNKENIGKFIEEVIEPKLIMNLLDK